MPRFFPAQLLCPLNASNQMTVAFTSATVVNDISSSASAELDIQTTQGSRTVQTETGQSLEYVTQLNLKSFFYS